MEGSDLPSAPESKPTIIIRHFTPAEIREALRRLSERDRPYSREGGRLDPRRKR